MVLKKLTGSSKREKFWKWFAANNHKYLFLPQVDEAEKDKLMDEFLAQLHKYCKHLYFEIGGHEKDHKVELIISAEGMVKYFDKVEELVDAAPDLPDWRFLKFRQPHPPGFETNYGGKIFDPEKIIFISLYSAEDPQGVGIQVCYPDFTDDEKNIFINGTFITLDSMLGEKTVALDIEYIEVIKTPEGISEEDYPTLSTLGQYIREKKYFKYPGENFSVIKSKDEKDYLIFITANLAYGDFRFKHEFPWLLRITIDVLECNENGHPMEDEAETLNSFENFLEEEIKKDCIAHYIGRTTLYKKRELVFYLDKPERATASLQFIRSNPDPVRNFDFTVEQDESWKSVSHFFAQPGTPD